MMSATLPLHSVMADPITRFVAYKRALGRDYRTEAAALRLFDRYLAEESVSCPEEVTPRGIETFLASRPRKRPLRLARRSGRDPGLASARSAPSCDLTSATLHLRSADDEEIADAGTAAARPLNGADARPYV